MTLFESDSQYREKLTIWRVLSSLPLYGSLAEGHIWRWFAINIPMDLGTGGEFTSDIDIIARLSDFPNSRKWFYKTWEVKVSLLCKDGTARSLKAGKIKRNITQLKAYKNYGSPSVTLLDIFICENGFMRNNVFPSKILQDVITHKQIELSKEEFGYQLLPFEHGKEKDYDIGLSAIASSNMLETKIKLLQSKNFECRQPFSRFVEDIDKFFKSLGELPRKNFNQIIYCRNCRQLQLIDMKKEYHCPNCKDDLIIQA